MAVSKENPALAHTGDRVEDDPGDLAARARDVVERAGAALGTLAEGGGVFPDDLTPTWQALMTRLEHGSPVAPADAARLCELFVEATQLQQDLRERDVAGRLAVLARIHEVLARLGEITTPSELIDAAPEALCDACSFDRALISRVRGSTWVPESLYIADGQDPVITTSAREYLESIEIPLGSMLMETEMVRRGTPMLVIDPANHPRTFKDLMTITQTAGYVAAPVMPAGRVIGFLHADAFGAGRELTQRDRDNLWTFAEGFGLIFERVILLQRLAAQRTQVHKAFQSAEATIDELCDAQLELARQEREIVPFGRSMPQRPNPQESRLHALLTPREREVLALMSGGATNSQIADQLVISQGTVKSHVKHVMRKLRASTRAEAVSRSLHLSMGEIP